MQIRASEEFIVRASRKARSFSEVPCCQYSLYSLQRHIFLVFLDSMRHWAFLDILGSTRDLGQVQASIAFDTSHSTELLQGARIHCLRYFAQRRVATRRSQRQEARPSRKYVSLHSGRLLANFLRGPVAPAASHPCRLSQHLCMEMCCSSSMSITRKRPLS